MIQLNVETWKKKTAATPPIPQTTTTLTTATAKNEIHCHWECCNYKIDIITVAVVGDGGCDGSAAAAAVACLFHVCLRKLQHITA